MASAGGDVKTATITVPSGTTKGILIVVIAGWASQYNSYTLNGNGILTKKTIESDANGVVNNSVLSTKFEVDECTLTPGGKITMTFSTTNYERYPSFRMFLIY